MVNINRNKWFSITVCWMVILIFVLLLLSQTKAIKRIKVPVEYDGCFRNANGKKYCTSYSNDIYLIKTKGCLIPNIYEKLFYKEVENKNQSCGKRIVFVNLISDYTISFRIDSKGFERESVILCCYQFIAGNKDESGKYPYCIPFQNGDNVTLQEEVLKVKCFITNSKELRDYVDVYEDAYLILKKINVEPSLKKTENNNKVNQNSRKQKMIHGSIWNKHIKLKKVMHKRSIQNKWNVLLIGMDSMSRGRAHAGLPKLVKYFQRHQWLDYRGYNKISQNTYSNMMALLTGINESTSGLGIDENKLIWNKFKESGYITAYLEEAIAPNFTLKFPKTKPTDHFPREYFELETKWQDSLRCTGFQITSVSIMNYIKDFVEVYRDNNFFGLFWLSYLSRNPYNVLIAGEKPLLKMFQSLARLGIIENTFILFYGDHGINFGHNRFSIESYYDDNLPMMFIWVPHEFRRLYKTEYINLLLNQYRLTTPFDIHATLLKILEMSNSQEKFVPPQDCPNCQGLFTKISNKRTCSAAKIAEHFCTCHGLYETDVKGVDYKRTVMFAVRFINDGPTKLTQVLRHHWYKRDNRTYYIIALTIKIYHSYEIVIEKSDKQLTVLHLQKL